MCLRPLLPQDGRKSFKDGLKRLPRDPKMAPRKAQEDSKMVKEASGGADHIVKYEVICTSSQDGPKMLSYACVPKV